MREALTIAEASLMLSWVGVISALVRVDVPWKR